MEALIPPAKGSDLRRHVNWEIEAMAVGLYETLDETIICQSPEFIKFMVTGCMDKGIPMVTPPRVLGAHVDAMKFCSHIPAVPMFFCRSSYGCFLPLFGSPGNGTRIGIERS